MKMTSRFGVISIHVSAARWWPPCGAYATAPTSTAFGAVTSAWTYPSFAGPDRLAGGMAPGVPGKRQPRPAGADHEDRFPDALRCRRRRWEPGSSAYGGADLTDA